MDSSYRFQKKRPSRQKPLASAISYRASPASHPAAECPLESSSAATARLGQNLKERGHQSRPTIFESDPRSSAKNLLAESKRLYLIHAKGAAQLPFHRPKRHRATRRGCRPSQETLCLLSPTTSWASLLRSRFDSSLDFDMNNLPNNRRSYNLQSCCDRKNGRPLRVVKQHLHITRIQIAQNEHHHRWQSD